MVTTHRQTLSNLKPATLYHFQVRSIDANSQTAGSTDANFTTAADTTPPSVSITSPTAGATLSGAVSLTASATDDVAVASVQFQLDGANLGTLDVAAPYAFSWDTTKSSNGTHTLKAIAKDGVGNTGTSAAVTVSVNNSTPDTTPPTVSITTPANGATVLSTVTVSANAADNVSVASVQFQLDGANVGTLDVASPYTFSWDTTKSANGSHTLKAVAKDGAGNTGTSAAVTVTVNNSTPDTTPPTVSITAPANGATVSSTVTVSANAADNVSVANVQFQLDGANLGSLDTTSPYSVSWDTTTASNGSHTLRAIATDPSNNSAISASVTVQVSNSSTPPTVALPLKASANRRYLVDQNNVPFLLIGDASHSLISAINTTDMVTYMTTRAGQGFNAIQVFAPCDTYEVNCPVSMASFSGVAPFTSGSSQTDYDLATPNPAYWSILDNLLSTAAAHNLVVFLNPLETGGLLGLFEHNGTTKVFNYGVFLGNRYKNTPNLVWDFGNDFQNWRNAPTDNNLVSQLMAGIASVDSNHLMDIELDYDRSYSNQDTTLGPSLSLDAAYTYFETYDCVLAAYNSAPTMPVIMLEANYEFQNNTGFLPGNTGAFVLRQQEYWTMTSGATGQFYGSHYTNHFNSGWQANMNTPGALEIVYLTQLFRSLPWWNLVPDQTHQIVTAGYGTPNGSSGNLPAANYSTTVWAPDGSLAVVYDPAGNALTVNLAKFSGPVTARWYDPSNGTYTPIAGSPFANGGSQVFSTPGQNHDGQSDWVLVLE